jgi:hypothetical protein
VFVILKVDKLNLNVEFRKLFDKLTLVVDLRTVPQIILHGELFGAQHSTVKNRRSRITPLGVLRGMPVPVMDTFLKLLHFDFVEPISHRL